jgi:hypothetical protein
MIFNQDQIFEAILIIIDRLALERAVSGTARSLRHLLHRRALAHLLRLRTVADT